MKYIGQKSLLTLFFIGIIAASCSKDSQNQYGDDMTYLPISDLVIHPLGDVAHVSYTSETEWTVDADESWIHFSSEKGVPGTTTLKISVDPNIDIDRDAVITFWSGSKAMDSFVVTQNMAVLNISKDRFDLGWKKESHEFSVKSNIQWEIQLNGEKKDKFAVTSHELDKVAGKIEKDFRPSEEVVTFEPNANNLSDEEDEVAITIVPVLVNGSGNKFELGEDVKEALTTTISISQDYLIFLINDSREDVTLGGFSELGEKYVEEGKVNMDEHVCSQKFTVVSEVDWKFDEAALAAVGGRLEEVAEPTDTTIDGRDAKVYTRILHMDEPNPTREVRPYDLKLWAEEDYEAARTVKVEQNPYVLDFDVESVSFVNVGETKTLKVNTTGPWKIENKPEWLTVVPSEGVDSCEVKISAPERNLNFMDLHETLMLTSLVPEVYSELPAKQDAFIFKVEEDEALYKMSRLDMKDHEVKIISSGPWELVLDGGSWLEIPGIQLDNGRYYCDNGRDTTTIVIKAKSANPDTNKDRDMTCLIRSTLHKDSDKEWNGQDRHGFSIMQERFRFEILTSIDEESTFIPQTFASYRSGENTQSFYLKCSARWKITLEKITSDENWLTFDKNEGSGEEYCTISMTATTNTDKGDREATVKVSADVNGDGVYDDERKIFVDQDGFVFDVTSSVVPTHTFGPWKAKEVEVYVNTVDGAGWEVESKDDYVKINGKGKEEMKTYKGEGESSFTFGPRDNGSTGFLSRDVTVTVTSKVSEETKTITYKQDPYEFDSTPVTLTAFDEISSNNSSQPVEVKCSGDWTLENVPGWLEIKEGNTKVTKGSGNATLSFKAVMNNVSLTSNEATVQVVSKVEDANATHTKNIKVSQNKYTWEVDGMGGKTLQYDAVDDLDSYKIWVKSSGEWEFSFDNEENEFFTLSEKEGGPSIFSSTLVELNVMPNYTLDDRDVTITLKSVHANENGELQDILIVKQEAYEYNVDVPKDGIKFTAEGGTKNVTVECSGGFDRVDVSSDGGWLSASISSGNLKIEAKSNDSKGSKAREGKIIIQSKDYKHNEALKTTIKVTQEAKKK